MYGDRLALSAQRPVRRDQRSSEDPGAVDDSFSVQPCALQALVAKDCGDGRFGYLNFYVRCDSQLEGLFLHTHDGAKDASRRQNPRSGLKVVDHLLMLFLLLLAKN